ncbi:MAG: thioredoxin [Candidatus Methylomirabilales bacterium]
MAKKREYLTVTDENFTSEVLKRPEPVLVDFWASWCGPCRMIAPVIEELAVDFEGRAKVAKVDVDDNPQVAARYDIRSIPTLLFFQDGQVVDRVIGVVPKKVLADRLSALLLSAEREKDPARKDGEEQRRVA